MPTSPEEPRTIGSSIELPGMDSPATQRSFTLRSEGSEDIERGPDRPPLRRKETHESTYRRPYANYAYWIGREPMFAIFRRFASLNAQNILALQAEIIHEEHKLHKLQEHDLEYGGEDGYENQTKFLKLMTAEKGTNGWEQWQQILKIRAKLKEYNALLIENEKVFNLPEPNQADYNELMKLLYIKGDHAEGNNWLEYPENIFEEEDGERLHHDLVTLGPQPRYEDRFTRSIAESRVVRMLCEALCKRRNTAFIELNERGINRVVGLSIIMCASLLPTVSIFALNYIHGTVKRLAFITIFEVVFTLSLAFFTDAKRIEVFAAAVALASVQVVFIGTQPGP